jgi:ankyrin repeat protein
VRRSHSLLVALISFASLAELSATPALLADAAERGDRERVNALLAERADVNATQPDGMTALHWAVHRDDVETVRLLIKAGANAKVANRYSVTPLSLACTNGNGTIVEHLLDAGAEANTALPGGETMLMIAARTGKPACVKALLQHGADVNARERKGQTALLWAAAEGNAEVVQLLIAAGADFRAPLPDSGLTPLMFAAREGRAEVARILVKAGADVTEATKPGKPHPKGPRKGTSALLLAVENGHFELALDLIEAGADPNDQRSGFTPLHAMSWVRKPNRGEDDGDPVPIGSGNLNSADFIRKLVTHGADPNARLTAGRGGAGSFTRLGATPFLMASSTADLQYMKLLLELGADPSLTNADNCTPLMVACGIGVGSAAANEVAGEEPEVLEAAEYLLGLGADVNAMDANGETAMHAAAYKNLPKVVAFLAQHGARPQIWTQKNKYGWTPLSIAEGHRPGNFKPSAETIEAIREVLRAAGIEPPLTSTTKADTAKANYAQ